MEDIWFNTALFKSMPHVSANIKSNHKAHKTGLVTQGHRMSKQWRKHLDRHFGGTKFQLTKLSNQLTHHDPRLLWHLFILTLESSAASRPQWTKFGPFLGEGGLLPFPIYFFIFYFFPFPSFYAICLVHVKGLCQRELHSPVENTASSRCLLWCTSQLFFRMSYITGLIFHRGFLSSECPSRHLQEGLFKFYALL